MTIPLLMELGYKKDFSTAIVAVAGGLGVIIPPSIPFIMYAMATGESVSDLFLAGIIPGLLIDVYKRQFQSYWSQTGTYDSIQPLINKDFDGLKSAIAVSYTHLDVYKRQILQSRHHAGSEV